MKILSDEEIETFDIEFYNTTPGQVRKLITSHRAQAARISELEKEVFEYGKIIGKGSENFTETLERKSVDRFISDSQAD
jgi:hypothetical protein